MLKLTHLAGFGGDRRPTHFDLTIRARTANVDLYSYLAARGYRNEPEVAVAIAAGVQVYATSTAGAGLTVNLARFPRNCRIALTVRGEICGRGGASGAAGGKALQVRRGSGATLAIDNRGEINGGGGGGARGSGDSCRNYDSSDKYNPCSTSTTYCAGGAGGAGYGPNAATGGASGQSRSCGGCGSCRGRSGSAGGGKGQAGSGAGGGAAGAAVAGTAYIRWTRTGVRNGAVT